MFQRDTTGTPPTEAFEPLRLDAVASDEGLLQFGADALEVVLILGIAVLVGLAIHALLFAIGRRITRHTETDLDEQVMKRLRGPLLILLPLLTVRVALPSVSMSGDLAGVIRQAMSIALIAGVTWAIVSAIKGVSAFVLARHDVGVADNLKARRVHTQFRVLSRILSILAIIVGAAAALMTFPAIRQLGTSLLASAGLAGLVVGFAARSSIANFIAGIQIALSEPLRLDDVVVIDGEWGRVEEITSTYVVVKIWDERRLIVPFSYVLDKPFTNWTRTNSRLLGTAIIHADYTAPIDALREELKRLCKESDLWDQRVALLQVTDATEGTIQLRALVSSGDAGKAWDLRCLVREGLIEFLQREHPAALPRTRLAIEDPPRGGKGSNERSGEPHES